MLTVTTLDTRVDSLKQHCVRMSTTSTKAECCDLKTRLKPSCNYTEASINPPSITSAFRCAYTVQTQIYSANRQEVKEHLLTYLLTPWCRVLLEKLTGLQLVKEFPAFHGNRRFITALTSVCHLSLSWANPIQSIYPHPTSWRSIIILSTHLRLGLPSGLLPSGFPTKTLYNTLSSPIRAT